MSGPSTTRARAWVKLRPFVVALAFATAVLPVVDGVHLPLAVGASVLVGFLVHDLLRRARRQTERAHALAAQRSRLLAVLSDGVIVTDAEGRVLEVNDALCAMTGYTPLELVGARAPLPSWPLEEHARLLREHAAAIAAGGGTIDARLVRKGGGDLFVHIALSVDRAGGAPTVIATVKDVSGQVELVDRLRAAHDRSSAIIDTMSEGYGLTSDGTIVEVNAALSAITGFSREQLVGATVPYPFWPPELHADLHQLRADIKAARGGAFEMTFMRVDGTRFLAETTTVEVRGAPGGPAGYLTTIRDITERHRAEEASRAREAELAALVDVTRAVAHASPSEARHIICDMARGLVEATTAAIWEADETGLLRTASILGASVPEFPLGDGHPEDGARFAFEHGRARFVGDATSSSAVDPRMRELLGCRSVHFEPVIGDQGPVGVLVLGWSHPVEALSDSGAHLLELLANEASVAIAKAATHAELERLARTDALTGLANRRVVEELLPREVAAVRRTGQPLTVAILDLDHFKAYNDAHGHPAGDRLLRTAGARWSQRLRETDVLARWGGEEFCLVLPGCDTAQAHVLLKAMRAALPDGQTFSAGVAAWTAGVDCDALIAHADQALYAAKRAGRARSLTAVPTSRS